MSYSNRIDEIPEGMPMGEPYNDPDNRPTNYNDKVLRFIHSFTNNGERKEVIKSFTEGVCYWFAKILSERFDGSIMYDEEMCHFTTLIQGRIYDITGDVSDVYTCLSWKTIKSIKPDLYEQVLKECINIV